MKKTAFVAWALVVSLLCAGGAAAAADDQSSSPASYNSLNHLSAMNGTVAPATTAPLPQASAQHSQAWDGSGDSNGTDADGKPQLLKKSSSGSGPVDSGSTVDPNVAAQTQAPKPDANGPQEATPWRRWASMAAKLLLASTVLLIGAGLMAAWGRRLLANPLTAGTGAALMGVARFMAIAALGAAALAAGVGVMLLTKWGQKLEGALMTGAGLLLTIAAWKAAAGDSSAGVQARAGMKAATDSATSQQAASIAAKVAPVAASTGSKFLTILAVTAGAGVAMVALNRQPGPQPMPEYDGKPNPVPGGTPGPVNPTTPTNPTTPGSPTTSGGGGSGAHPIPPVLPGWDPAKWNDPTYHSAKYDVGRILATYPHTPDGLKQALPEIQKEYPGTTIVGSKGDSLKFPNGTTVDVIAAAGEGGKSWWWGTDGNPEPARTGTTPVFTPPAPTTPGPTTPPAPKPNPPPPTNPGSGQHPDRSAVVAQAKSDLQKAGKDLSGPCGAFSIVELAAWRMSGEGAGLLSKPSGNNCNGYATDIIAYPDGHIFDVLVSAGETNGPSWGDDGTVDATRWRAPYDPSAN